MSPNEPDTGEGVFEGALPRPSTISALAADPDNNANFTPGPLESSQTTPVQGMLVIPHCWFRPSRPSLNRVLPGLPAGLTRVTDFAVIVFQVRLKLPVAVSKVGEEARAALKGIITEEARYRRKPPSTPMPSPAL